MLRMTYDMLPYHAFKRVHDVQKHRFFYSYLLDYTLTERMKQDLLNRFYNIVSISDIQCEYATEIRYTQITLDERKQKNG